MFATATAEIREIICDNNIRTATNAGIRETLRQQRWYGDGRGNPRINIRQYGGSLMIKTAFHMFQTNTVVLNLNRSSQQRLQVSRQIFSSEIFVRQPVLL